MLSCGCAANSSAWSLRGGVLTDASLLDFKVFIQVELKLLHFYWMSGLMIKKAELIINHLCLSPGYVSPALIMFSWIKLQLNTASNRKTSFYNLGAFTFHSKILTTDLFLYYNKLRCSWWPVAWLYLKMINQMYRCRILFNRFQLSFQWEKAFTLIINTNIGIRNEYSCWSGTR